MNETTTTDQEKAIALHREMEETARDLNNVLSASDKVSPVFMAHFADMLSGKHGVAYLIANILTTYGALFSAEVAGPDGTLVPLAESSFRNIAIASSMFSLQVFEETQNEFSAGSKRYPIETIVAYLTTFMAHKGKFKIKGLPSIGKIQLTNAEDFNRPKVLDKNGVWRKTKPRCVWYLVQE